MFQVFLLRWKKAKDDIGGHNTSSVQMPFSDEEILQWVTPKDQTKDQFLDSLSHYLCHVFFDTSLSDTKKCLQNLKNTTGFKEDYSTLCDAIQNLRALPQKVILKIFEESLKEWIACFKQKRKKSIV